jgi:hypothetical protein
MGIDRIQTCDVACELYLKNCTDPRNPVFQLHNHCPCAMSRNTVLTEPMAAAESGGIVMTLRAEKMRVI